MSFLRLLIKYSAHHILFSMLGGYFILSLFLKIFFQTDITVPCLFTTLSGYNCWGCGITRAFIHLLEFELADAWRANPIAFIVFPAGVFYIVNDFLEFKKHVGVELSKSIGGQEK